MSIWMTTGLKCHARGHTLWFGRNKGNSSILMPNRRYIHVILNPSFSQRTYPHWPAKLMRFNSERNTIDVRYFGDDHLRAVLPVKDCLLYSEQNPSKTIGRFKKSLNVAVNVRVFHCFLFKMNISMLNSHF